MLICGFRRVCVCFLNEYTRPENCEDSNLQFHNARGTRRQGKKSTSVNYGMYTNLEH
jgi:hypothetical protein